MRVDVHHYASFNVAESDGRVKDHNVGGGLGFVYFVAEAWGNVGFARAELRTLERLYTEMGVRHFFVEGAFYDLPAAGIRAQAGQASDLEALFARGQIKPIEYMATIHGDWDFFIHQMDDQGLYDEANAAYQASRRTREGLSDVVEQLCELLASRRQGFAEADRELYEAIVGDERALQRGKREFVGTIRAIASHAQRLGVDLGDTQLGVLAEAADERVFLCSPRPASLCEHLLGLLKDQDPPEDRLARVLIAQARLERLSPRTLENLSFAAIQALYQRAVKHLGERLEAGRSVITMGSPLQRAQAATQEISIARLLGVDLAGFPAVRQSHGQLITLGRAFRNPMSYHHDLESAGERLLKRADPSGLLYRIYRLELDLLRMKDLFKLQVSYSQVREVDRLRNTLRLDRALDRLKSFGLPESTIEGMRAAEEAWDLSISRVARFYAYNVRRSRHMLEACRRHLSEVEVPVGVLMAGGFHIEPMVGDLRRRADLSSVTVQLTFDTSAAEAELDAVMDSTNR